MSVYTIKEIRSNAFSATSGSGQKWTSLKRFTPVLASSTWAPDQQNAS